MAIKRHRPSQLSLSCRMLTLTFQPMPPIFRVNGSGFLERRWGSGDSGALSLLREHLQPNPLVASLTISRPPQSHETRLSIVHQLAFHDLECPIVLLWPEDVPTDRIGCQICELQPYRIASLGSEQQLEIVAPVIIFSPIRRNSNSRSLSSTLPRDSAMTYVRRFVCPMAMRKS